MSPIMGGDQNIKHHDDNGGLEDALAIHLVFASDVSATWPPTPSSVAGIDAGAKRYRIETEMMLTAFTAPQGTIQSSTPARKECKLVTGIGVGAWWEARWLVSRKSM